MVVQATGRHDMDVDVGSLVENAIVTFECAVGSVRARGKLGMLDGSDFDGGDGRPCGWVGWSFIATTFPSTCVLVIAGATFTDRENLRNVAVSPLSKSCNLSIAHSLCVFVRAWLLAISESSSLGERGVRSSIICLLWF